MKMANHAKAKVFFMELLDFFVRQPRRRSSLVLQPEGSLHEMLFNKLGSTQLGLPQNSDFKILASVIAMSIGIPLCLRILHLRQIGTSKQHEVRLALRGSWRQIRISTAQRWEREVARVKIQLGLRTAAPRLLDV